MVVRKLGLNINPLTNTAHQQLQTQLKCRTMFLICDSWWAKLGTCYRILDFFKCAPKSASQSELNPVDTTHKKGQNKAIQNTSVVCSRLYCFSNGNAYSI